MRPGQSLVYNNQTQQNLFLQNIASTANIERHPLKDKIYSKSKSSLMPYQAFPLGFVVDNSQYNTITNPIPNFNTNPYLNKVVQRAQLLAQTPMGGPAGDMRRSNVLTNAASQ